MSQIYSGNASNIAAAAPPPLAITLVTNTVNPTITVSSLLPAGFVAGITVDIFGVQGAVAINGQWTVLAVTSLTTFTVATSAPGAYTSSTGTVQPLYLAAITQPSDGDVRNAASVDVPIQGLADMSAFLATAAGAYKLVQQSAYFYLPTPGSNAGIEFLSLLTNGAWVFVSSGSGYSPPQIDRLIATDILEIEIKTTVSVDNESGQTGFLFAPGAAFFQPGASPPAFSPLEDVQIANPGVTTGPRVPITMKSLIAPVGTTGSVILNVGAMRLDGTGTPVANFFRSLRFYWKVWRPTSMPQ